MYLHDFSIKYGEVDKICIGQYVISVGAIYFNFWSIDVSVRVKLDLIKSLIGLPAVLNNVTLGLFGFVVHNIIAVTFLFMQWSI